MPRMSTKKRKAKFNTDDLILEKSLIYEVMLIFNTTLLIH